MPTMQAIRERLPTISEVQGFVKSNPKPLIFVTILCVILIASSIGLSFWAIRQNDHAIKNDNRVELERQRLEELNRSRIRKACYVLLSTAALYFIEWKWKPVQGLIVSYAKAAQFQAAKEASIGETVISSESWLHPSYGFGMSSDFRLCECL